MWEWKLAVWWNRDNKGRAREKFANSKIEARSVEHGKLLPPSIFCYYQASGHRPIGSVAKSWVEGLCFDLNYQWFKYLFWTEGGTKKLEIFRVFNGLLLELILAFIRHICVHRLIFRRWSDCNCKGCNVLGLSKDNQSWQTHVARWEGSWIDEISGGCALAALFWFCWFSCLQNYSRNLLSWDRSWWDFALLPRRPLLQIPHVFFWRLFSPSRKYTSGLEKHILCVAKKPSKSHH